MLHRRRPEAGLTLLEIMIVLVLMGLIATAIGGWLMRSVEDGYVKTTKLQVRDLAAAVQQYMINKGGCPTVDDLVAGRYVRAAPEDPWHRPILVRCPGRHDPDGVDILSLGPDGEEGTDDDIKSWGK